MNQNQNSVSTPAPGSNAATGVQQPNRGGGRRGGRGGRDGRGGGRGYFKKVCILSCFIKHTRY